jgi:ubiquinone/menaquinone biosynthesis C-methylase UbiE
MISHRLSSDIPPRVLDDMFVSADARRRVAMHPFEDQMNEAIERAKYTARRRQTDTSITDFDIRGELYDLAHRMAPLARQEELDVLRALALPRPGELAIDIAAGSGFLTESLQDWTGRPPYALDPSREQLGMLRQRVPRAETLLGLPDDPELFDQLSLPEFDLATSLGGLHHVDDQRTMFANIAKLLRRGGRFVFGDVSAHTTVARHFDLHVASKCLTGHSARWLSPAALPVLVAGTGLRVVKAGVRLLHMRFQSELQMALFFKGLHAYDLTPAAIAQDLITTLGVDEHDGLLCLKWPLLFAALEKA